MVGVYAHFRSDVYYNNQIDTYTWHNLLLSPLIRERDEILT